jgi:halimadienyl-diphosphate synthase
MKGINMFATSETSLVNRFSLEALQLVEAMAGDYAVGKGGVITPSYYDTAWLLRVNQDGKPAFPEALTWLLDNQNGDGSWGEFPYSILSTLSCLAALASLQEASNSRAGNACTKAHSWLTTTLPSLDMLSLESCGFEVLGPGLLRELEGQGYGYTFPGQAELTALYRQKMSLFSPEALYAAKSNLLYSLECLEGLDYPKLPQSPDGGYGCSPSATARLLADGFNNEKAYAWLENLVTTRGGNVPTTYPLEVFEAAWSLYHLRSSLPVSYFPASVNAILDMLELSLGEHGAGFSRQFPIADADDSCLAVLVLASFGRKVNLDFVGHYEREKFFTCFVDERNTSLSNNAHILEALLVCTDWQNQLPAVLKLVDYLFSTQNETGYWEDKWHHSPYYATFCATQALALYPLLPQSLALVFTWVLHSQNSDGGWGESGSNPEETAYALKTLLLEQNPSDKSRYAVQRAKSWLVQNYRQVPSRLWRGKELYSPERVVKATVLSALLSSVGY